MRLTSLPHGISRQETLPLGGKVRHLVGHLPELGVQALKLTDLRGIIPVSSLFHSVKGIGFLQPGHHLVFREGDLLFLVVDLQPVSSRRFGFHRIAGRGNAALAGFRGEAALSGRLRKEVLSFLPALRQQRVLHGVHPFLFHCFVSFHGEKDIQKPPSQAVIVPVLKTFLWAAPVGADIIRPPFIGTPSVGRGACRPQYTSYNPPPRKASASSRHTTLPPRFPPKR